MKILDKYIFIVIIIFVLIYFFNKTMYNSDYFFVYNTILIINLMVITTTYIFICWELKKIKKDINNAIKIINKQINEISVQNLNIYEETIEENILILHNFIDKFEYKNDIQSEKKILESIKTDFLLKKIIIYI